MLKSYLRRVIFSLLTLILFKPEADHSNSLFDFETPSILCPQTPTDSIDVVFSCAELR
jgi:hypothetical protein